jgi:hypothetical protein
MYEDPKPFTDVRLPDFKLFGPVETFAPQDLTIFEDTAYKEGTVTWGYGQVGGVEIELTKGASVKLNIDFNVLTIESNTFSQWKSDTSSFFSDAQRQTLDERWGGSGHVGGFFGGCFGVVFGGGDAYHYKDQQNSSYSASNTSQEGFAQSVYNLDSRQFRITGEINAVGLSNIPTKVRIFIQTFKVQFSNGKELRVIDLENPVAASPSGDTKVVKADPTTLTQVPFP